MSFVQFNFSDLPKLAELSPVYEYKRLIKAEIYHELEENYVRFFNTAIISFPPSLLIKLFNKRQGLYELFKEYLNQSLTKYIIADKVYPYLNILSKELLFLEKKF